MLSENNETQDGKLVEVFTHPSDGLPFIKLEGVNTQTATDIKDFVENTRRNLKKPLKGIEELPTFQVVKGHDKPIALIGGGPSIKKELENIKEFQSKGYVTIACGSSHDWLVENGVIPTYCTVCDPDPVSIEYLKLKNNKVKYLIAFSCDEKIVDYLSDQEVYLWHCHSPEACEILKEDLEAIKRTYVAICGGCTVGLRTISMAIMFGYTNIHLWGFDSCLGEDEAHHAYEFATEGEKWQIKDIHKIKMGGVNGPDSKIYNCLGYQLAQAYHFHQFYNSYHALFTPTFHGEGMLADFMKLMEKEGVLNEYAKKRLEMLNTNEGTYNG